MAACYLEEEEHAWKCPKHPSKRRHKGGGGICPSCLRERLVSLCPECANVRPCACPLSATSTTVAQFSNLIDVDPSFRRSRSVAAEHAPSNGRVKATSSFLSILIKRNKTKEKKAADNLDSRIEDFARLVTRSRSVSATASESRATVQGKPKFWHFPSPIKAFTNSRTPKVVVQHRSPLHR